MYRGIPKVYDRNHPYTMGTLAELLQMVVQYELSHFYKEDTLRDFIWGCASNSHSLYA